MTTTLGPLEAETCRDYVVLRLLDAGWSQDQIIEHVTPSRRHMDASIPHDYRQDAPSAHRQQRPSRGVESPRFGLGQNHRLRDRDLGGRPPARQPETG